MQVNHFEKPVQKVEAKKDNMVFAWHVTSDFFEQKEKPNLDASVSDLITKHNILKFTHNPLGPAITQHKDGKQGYESYWLNGLPAKKEEVERLKYNAEFHDHVDKSLNES